MFSRCQPATRPSTLASQAGLWNLLLALSLLVSGCSVARPAATAVPADLNGFFPAANAIPGWEISQTIQTYTHDDLFNLVDGQAESFFAYGFESVAVGRYQDASAFPLNVEIWQLATSADAYGLFSAGRTGSPADVGIEADSDPGRRLAFWQDRYFVSLNAVQPLADETLQDFARAVSGKLPSEGMRPAIVGRLPQTGMEAQSVIFFHEEMSIQMEVWLGGENILGLSQATNGVVASYSLGDATARLMLIEYPNSSQASKARKALQKAALPDLLASQENAALLGAVFGKADANQAEALLQDALK